MKSYLSKLYPNEFIITESNASAYAPTTPEYHRGLDLSQKSTRDFSQPFLKAFDLPLIPRSEYRDRIEEREKNGATLSRIVRQKKVPTSNQDGTNFCWTYGVVTAINCMRAWRNLPYIEFSRESVAAPLKNYSNSGGWGDQALARIVSHGIMPQELWPRYYYSSSKYNTEANLKVAANYKVSEFWILPDNSFAACMTALLLDMPVAVGYNWWSHEVCGIDPVVIGSDSFGIRIWNSWGDSYGDKGMVILSEGKATANDQVIPIVQCI